MKGIKEILESHNCSNCMYLDDDEGDYRLCARWYIDLEEKVIKEMICSEYQSYRDHTPCE